jgi:hypothetical protein
LREIIPIPLPTGTYTRQEAPSFAWRTNAAPDNRQAYIDMLLGLSAGQGKTKVRIVCTMRRDYYNLCSQYDAFSP